MQSGTYDFDFRQLRDGSFQGGLAPANRQREDLEWFGAKAHMRATKTIEWGRQGGDEMWTVVLITTMRMEDLPGEGMLDQRALLNVVQQPGQIDVLEYG